MRWSVRSNKQPSDHISGIIFSFMKPHTCIALTDFTIKSRFEYYSPARVPPLWSIFSSATKTLFSFETRCNIHLPVLLLAATARFHLFGDPCVMTYPKKHLCTCCSHPCHCGFAKLVEFECRISCVHELVASSHRAAAGPSQRAGTLPSCACDGLLIMV